MTRIRSRNPVMAGLILKPGKDLCTRMPRAVCTSCRFFSCIFSWFSLMTVVVLYHYGRFRVRHHALSRIMSDRCSHRQLFWVTGSRLGATLSLNSCLSLVLICMICNLSKGHEHDCCLREKIDMIECEEGCWAFRDLSMPLYGWWSLWTPQTRVEEYWNFWNSFIRHQRDGVLWLSFRFNVKFSCWV